MKISFVTKKPGYHSAQIKTVAEKMGIELDVVDIKIQEDLFLLGDIVIWRSSTIDKKDAKKYLEAPNKVVFYFNKGIFDNPAVSQKYFQQETASLHKIPTIKTYQATTKAALLELVRSGALRFPFICKPNVGSKGEGIYLFSSAADIHASSAMMKKHVFQNFIKNEGDFRVLVLGGKVLGVMKRKAKNGFFLNNFSQGGSIELITDEVLIKKVSSIAVKISAIFNLAFCGVDIIYDVVGKRFLFLEVNTAPEWKGFQKATKINVGKELVNFCIHLSEAKSNTVHTSVEKYYKDNLAYLQDKKFHFASRLFLWNKDYFCKKELRALKKDYIGESVHDYRKQIKTLFCADNNFLGVMYMQKRRCFFEKFPKLPMYNKLLFKYLFSKSVYAVDLRRIISEKISDQEIISLRNELLKDGHAIAALSTHAINYLYLSNYYLGLHADERELLNLLTISKKYTKKSDIISLSLRIYLLTHCIIGATAFYSKKITNNLDVYLVFIKEIEGIIMKHYDALSLDTKFEFLVCCKICSYKSSLEKLILNETDKSMSPLGSFLVDTTNGCRNLNQNSLVYSEHRNVLAIMSQKQYINNN